MIKCTIDVHVHARERGREGGREREREGGRERERERERERGREGEREGGREGGKREREGGRLTGLLMIDSSIKYKRQPNFSSSL